MIAYVYEGEALAGELGFNGNVYSFVYDENFLKIHQAISLTLPK